MLIILDKVNYVYSEGSGFEMKALKDISLTINKGEFIGLQTVDHAWLLGQGETA